MPGLVDPNEPNADSVPVKPRYLKLDEVAIYLNVSVTQVYAMVHSRELPAIKIGRRGVWRVTATSLSAISPSSRPTPEPGPRLIP
jgi:excisionase family DNA binding protein